MANPGLGIDLAQGKSESMLVKSAFNWIKASLANVLL